MKTIFVGEFPTINEDAPFTNGHWRYMRAMSKAAGLDLKDSLYLNVFNKSASSMYSFTQPLAKGAFRGIPYLAKKAYVREEFGHDIETLWAAIARIKPNLVVSFGDVAYTVLTRLHGLEANRGRITTTVEEAGETKLLPLLHPRMVLSTAIQEPVFLSDLQKAAREQKFPEVKRPRRFIHIRPSIEDLEDYWNTYLRDAPIISTDIETKGTFITCIGFAATADRALVVPFYDEELPDKNYWRTFAEERLAWQFVKRITERDACKVRLLGQNFLYDAQYLLRQNGVKTTGYAEDTMVLHHTLQMEMRKSLGFQASLYTDELAWKDLNKRRSDDKSGKKEDE